MYAILLSLTALAGSPLWQQTPAEVDAYLAAQMQRTPAYLDRFAQIVRDSVGTPYHDGPLGEGPGAPYDSDPLIDLSRADCVTFVEQAVALAASNNLAETTENLQRIRYAGAKVDFEARNHFLVADWVPNNPWCRERTAALGIPVQKVTRTISKVGFFQKVKAPALGQDIADRQVTLNYIPIEDAARISGRLRKPALIVFIGHVDWLFALHCGIYLPSDDGAGSLYHASSKAKKAISMDLADYAREQGDRYLGIAVYEITPPEWAVAPR